MKLLEFFEESNGQLSNTRLMATLSTLTALFLVIHATLTSTPPPGMDTLLVLLGYAGVTKVAQKMAEEKKAGA